MQVLIILAQAQGSIVDRETLNRRAWGGRRVSDDALDRALGKLRRLADDRGPLFEVETLPRVGFRLVAPASTVVTDDAPQSSARSRPGRRAVLMGATLMLASAGAGGYAIYNRSKRSLRLTAAPLVAVLPFNNFSKSEDLAYLGAGLGRQIRDALSRISGLRVTAEASSKKMAASGLDWRAAAARLGAVYLVDGDVEAGENELRISARLLDGENGSTVWSQTIAGTDNRLFDLQDQMTRLVLRELIGRVGVVPTADVKNRARDGRVFRLVLEGEDLFERSRQARMDGAIERAFDHADRSYALAEQALGSDNSDPSALLLLARLTKNGWTRALAAQRLRPEQRVTNSIEFVTKALAADPNDPAAMTALGDYYRRYEWRWAEAETLFRRALSIDPNYIEAHWSYAYQLGTTGRSLEGLQHAQIIFILDPEATWRRVALPRLLDLVGERDKAAGHYDTELQATPANAFLILELYIGALGRGDAQEIERLVSRVRGLNPKPVPDAVETTLTRLSLGAAALRGRPGPFIAAIDADVAAYDSGASDERNKQSRASVDLLYIYALEYAWAGANDAALVMFKRAFAARALYWPLTLPLGFNPLPQQLRNDQRYRAIWTADPQLRNVYAMRRRALATRQMAGHTEDGSLVRPAPSAIDQALAI